jgi:hypothetical protein
VQGLQLLLLPRLVMQVLLRRLRKSLGRRRRERLHALLLLLHQLLLLLQQLLLLLPLALGAEQPPRHLLLLRVLLLC